jgi:hypothetical protein
LSTLLHQRVSRRPQLRSLIDQQRTLGNRAVLRLLGLEERTPQDQEPPVQPAPLQEPPPPDPPARRRWWVIGGFLSLAVAEGLRRWFGD